MRTLLCITGLFTAGLLHAQFDLHFDSSIPVTRNQAQLSMAWAGGINFAQVSDIDLNGDGVKDLFLFDRSGNKVITFLNNGTEGQVDYTFTHAYDNVYPFPELQQWALMRDYNCDGKEDIFAYINGGVTVYKNTSVGPNLSFVQVDTLVRSNYQPAVANLYITQVDIPGIEDVDGDGDLDILTFSIFGNFVEYHRNLSMELYGTCDSLDFEVRNRCWGFFAENLSNNSVRLNEPCQFNVSDPELPEQVAEWAEQLRSNDPAVATQARQRLKAAHVGSTVLPIDLDGDGDKDLILGDVIYNTLTALTNGGSIAQANMTAQDTVFPDYDESVYLSVFPAAYYEDVNDDGKRDLLVAPNTQAHNFQSMWYYRNDGTDAAPIFHFQQDNLFQDRMMEFGEGAYPVLFDYNGDGLMDLVVGDFGYYQQGPVYHSKLALLRNVGTATDPAFDLVTDHFADLDTTDLLAMYPAFADLDGDGDKDMYIGEYNGNLYFYRNIGSATAPQFTPLPSGVMDDTGSLIDVGMFSAPQFFDMDDDGLLDLLVGERNGNLDYFHNTGTSSAPVWHLENDSVGGVNVCEWWNVTGYSTPFMYRGPDNHKHLLLGSESGWIHEYGDIDGNVNGTWTLVDSTWMGIHEGERTGIALYDLNNNGSLDAIIGNYRGGLGFWRNDYAVGIAEHWMDSDAFSVAPNPANTGADLLLHVPVGPEMRLDLLDGLGQVVRSLPVRGKRVHVATDDLRNGMYLLRLTDGRSRWTQRLAVVHG